MDKESTVPTAVAFIGFILVAVFCFIIIRDNVNERSAAREQQESHEIGKLADIKVNIAGTVYTAVSESNKAAKSFLTHLPLDMEMTDLNDNSKRGYTYFKLTTDAKRLGKVEVGDLLISGDSYVLIVTKTFKTSDKYTKLGHIQNLGEVPKGPVQIYISKME